MEGHHYIIFLGSVAAIFASHKIFPLEGGLWGRSGLQIAVAAYLGSGLFGFLAAIAPFMVGALIALPLAIIIGFVVNACRRN